MKEGREILRAEGRSTRSKILITIAIIPIAITSTAIIDTIVVPISPENLTIFHKHHGSFQNNKNIQPQRTKRNLFRPSKARPAQEH